ncbi:hypothetical protein LTR28_001670 [Elasticomyces elasticus]|nr:hypothetical protein LTR28_001670 [Elasticomyces elasticus]
MSSNLMDTEIGGEQTQYEGYKGLNDGHKKSGGQMGTPTSTPSNASASAERGAQTAENIRYGQAVSEQGVGGFTTGSDGVAKQEGGGAGAGGVDEGGMDKQGEESRVQQGYGGAGDMDRTVGG